MAKQRALLAFQELQFRFKQELKAVNAGVNARRGTPLTSATCGTNIAKDSRNVASLNLTTQTQTHNLVKFTNHAKFLGNGLAVIDFGSRVGNSEIIGHPYVLLTPPVAPQFATMTKARCEQINLKVTLFYHCYV